MASLASTVPVSLSFAFPRISDSQPPVFSAFPGLTKRPGLKVMAVAKFKGTQMREKQLAEMIEKKVQEATAVCEGDSASDECKVAWDEVEEVSQAKADLRRKMEKEDPLESYCQENPETDECRIYED